MNCARNYENLLNFVNVMPKIKRFHFYRHGIIVLTSEKLHFRHTVYTMRGKYRVCSNTYLTVSPSVTSVIGISVSLNVGELSTTRVSMSPTIVTFSFFTETVFSVIVTSASGAVTSTTSYLHLCF